MPPLLGLVFLGAVFLISLFLVGGRDGLRCLFVFLGCLGAIAVSAWAWARGGAWAFPAMGACILFCAILNIAGFLPSWRLRKAALFGGMLALLGPILIAILGVWCLKLTGAYTPSLRDVWYGAGTRHIPQHFVILGLVVLTSVGAIADLAIAVTAVMAELRDVGSGVDRRQLAAAGMRLGSDVTGTELNTLIYAFLGLQFGVVLLPFAQPDVRNTVIPWLEVANRQSTAVVTLAALAGTAGLLLAIPLTAWAGSRLLAESS